MIWNTREQVLSTDLNRAESFIHADMAEIFRALHSSMNQPQVFNDEGNEINGREDHNSTEIPLWGRVLSGLLCRPTNASMTVVVDYGTAMVVDPDPSPLLDDSPYKLIRDQGTSLTVLQNTSGSTRVDVIECSRSDVITETDSRNQYNTGTGLFAPVSFSKVGVGQFTYRVRQGTPGSGVPAAVQGWLPLCVLSIPTGTTTTLGDVAFWDVRPLVGARVRATNEHQFGFGHFKWCKASATVISGNLWMEGQAEVVDDWGYRLGGMLQTTGASIALHNSETSLVPLLDTNVTEPGFIAPNNGYVYIYLAVPVTNDSAGNKVPLLGPRWCRYMRALSEFIPASQVVQQPSNPTGFVVVSTTAPSEAGTAILSSPTALGLSCQMKGYCIAMAYSDSTAVVRPFIMDGRVITFLATFAGTSEPKLTFTNVTGSPANVANFTLRPDRDYPRNAKRIFGNGIVTNFATNGASGYQFFSHRLALQSNTSVYETLGYAPLFIANIITAVTQHQMPVSIPIESHWSSRQGDRIFSIIGEGAAGPIYANANVSVTVTGFEF